MIKENLIAINHLQNEIKSSLDQKIISAIRFIVKSEKEIRIINYKLHPLNNNFLVISISFPLEIGDKIKLSNGEEKIISEENKKTYENNIFVFIPIMNLEDMDSLEIKEKIDSSERFITNFGMEVFEKCLARNIIDLDDLSTQDHENFLEEITKPKEPQVTETVETNENIWYNLDEIQRVHLKYFSENQSKTVN